MHILSIVIFFAILKTTDTTLCLTKQIPDQIRLACAGDTGVSVGWHTYACSSTGTNPNPNPTVYYGLAQNSLNFTSINGNSTSYDTSNITNKSWFYSVEMQGLQPSTVYYYQIQASSNVSASDILFFTSAPSLGDQSRVISIVSYGDLGVDGLVGQGINGSFNFERALIAFQQILSTIDFFLHHGDVCYADDTPIAAFGTYESAYDYCQVMMTNITSKKFYMITVGNHEINCTEVPGASNACPSSYQNQIPYSHRFHMPSKQSGGYLNSCFSNASSKNLIDNMTQINWLINDLRNVNRSITPWVIAHGHRPWKGSIAIEPAITGGVLNCPACKAAFESILIQYNVDIYLAGHVHWYERICLNNTVNTTQYNNPSGPVYLTSGGIGSPEGNAVILNRSNESCFLTNEPGFGILRIMDAVHATYTYYRSSDMTQLDQITIIKNR